MTAPFTEAAEPDLLQAPAISAAAEVEAGAAVCAEDHGAMRGVTGVGQEACVGGAVVGEEVGGRVAVTARAQSARLTCKPATRLALAALALQVLAAAPASAQIPNGPQSVQSATEIRALEAPGASTSAQLERLPLASGLPPYRWFASTDAAHRNNDFVLLKPGETRRVPLAAGELERLWSTASEPDTLSLGLANGADTIGLLDNNRLRSKSPLVDKTFLFYGGAPAPSSVNQPEDGLGSGAALVATNRAKVPSKWFYQATVRPPSRPQVLEVRGAPKIVNATRLLKTSESLGAADVSGGFAFGVVDEVKITLQPATLETWNRCFLRGWATQREKPLGSISEGQSAPTTFNPKFAIDAPLLSFTGQFFGAGSKSDAVSSFDGNTLTLRWPLPFDAQRDAPALDIVNLSSGRVAVTVQARVRELKSQPATIFHAHLGSALSKPGAPIPIAQVKGEGAFVGLALGIRPTAASSRRAFAYLEGNETIAADGKSFEGTGSEDFFNSAWYFPDKPFARPFGGATWKQALPPQVAAYRWMVPDPLPFKREFSFAFEHGNRNNSDDLEYRWLACFYAVPQATWAIPDDLSSNPDEGDDPRRDIQRRDTVRRYILGTLGAMIGIAVLVAGVGLLRRSGR